MILDQAEIDALVAAAARPKPAVARVSTAGSKWTANRDLQRILGIYLPVSVTLAERELSVQSILSFKVGTILEFDTPSESDLPLLVANRRIGQGQAVKVGENFGLRVSAIGTMQDRVGAMSGA